MQAILNVISNPVNSTVPIAAEVLKSMGKYDKRKLFGVTTLDVVSFAGTPACPDSDTSLFHNQTLASSRVMSSRRVQPYGGTLQSCTGHVTDAWPAGVMRSRRPACPQVRARTFYAEKTGTNVADVDVPVVGGHAGITILPLFSQASPGHSMDKATVEALTKRTQEGGTEVVQAKAGKVGSTSSQTCQTVKGAEPSPALPA